MSVIVPWYIDIVVLPSQRPHPPSHRYLFQGLFERFDNVT